MTQMTHATKSKTACKTEQRRPSRKQAKIQLTRLKKLIGKKEEVAKRVIDRGRTPPN